jgi:flavin reductase (DIM6/NTAB) family NADH-FMN oxidoreductase RutF
MELDPGELWKVLAPRLTILITTVDKDGRINAAPFSFTSPVSFDPPIVMVSLRATRHTYQNIIETKEFVINILGKERLDAVLRCAARFPKGVNELEQAGLGWYSSKLVKPPRVKEASVWMECRYLNQVEEGDHFAVFGRVLVIDVRDEILADGKPDLAKLNPVLHIARNEFATDLKLIRHRRYD